MTKIIFNNLNPIDNICIQLNTVKGHAFLDNVGAIINSFYQDKTPPKTHINEFGQIIVFNPFEGIAQMKIDNIAIWASLQYNEEVTKQLEYFSKKVTNICDMLNVTDFLRIGFKCTYAHFFDSKEDRTAFIKTIITKDLEDIAIITRVKIDEQFSAKIEAFPVLDKAIDKEGISLDVDIYSDKDIDISNLVELFKKMQSKVPDALKKLIG